MFPPATLPPPVEIFFWVIVFVLPLLTVIFCVTNVAPAPNAVPSSPEIMCKIVHLSILRQEGGLGAGTLFVDFDGKRL